MAIETGISEYKLKLVYVYKEDENKVITIITNQLDWEYNTIAELYKKRWDIELFFIARKNLFEEIEAHKLSLLPQQRYEIKQQSMATVMLNGHVLLSEDKHYYSVPYQYIRKKVKLLYSSKTVEIYHKYIRIAVYFRLKSPNNYTTTKEHLASTHQFVTDWTPQRFINRGGSIDQSVKQLIINILEKKQHPEQAYKSCMGVLSLAKKVGNERLTNACARALDYGIHNYKIVQSILEKGLDKIKQDTDVQQELPLHNNIRGKKYYQ